MTRKLKSLILAAMALGVFGAFNVAGAQAAEFHRSAEPCTFTLKTDGTGATAHQVFVVRNSVNESISFTCTGISGEGTTATKTATTIEFKNIKYSGGTHTCSSVLGQATVHMNGCTYTIQSHITAGKDDGPIIIDCPAGKEIEITNVTCNIDVPAQALKGIGISGNIGPVGSREVTATAKVPGIAVNVRTPAGCVIDTTKTPITAEYTTGNVLVTAETDPGGIRADGWWE